MGPYSNLVLTSLALLGAALAFKKAIQAGIYDLTTLILQVFLRLLSVCFLYSRGSRQWFGESVELSNHVRVDTDEADDTRMGSSHNPVQGIKNSAEANNLQEAKFGTTTLASVGWRSSHRLVRLTFIAGGIILAACLAAFCIRGEYRTRRIDAIRDAIHADVALAKQLFGTNSMVEADAKTIQAYTQGLREIDRSQCPHDFQMAYLEHIHAWEAMARSHASRDIVGPLIELLVFKTLPDLPGASEDQPLREEIMTTWNEVERIALAHGVTLPLE